MEDWNVSTPIQVSVNVQGFDAATLNGLPGSFYLNAGNLTGTINTARIPILNYLPLSGGSLSGGVTSTELKTTGTGGITLEATGYAPFTIKNSGKTEAGLSNRYVFFNMKASDIGGALSNCFCIYSYDINGFKSIPFVISDTDNVGIGTATPSTKLQVAGAITASNINLTATTASTNTTTGAMTVTGGVGVQGNQYIGGFSSLGGDPNHPAIKIKKLIGTTASTQGGATSIAHGLTTTKIIHISAAVAQTAGQLMCNGFQALNGYQFDVADNGTSIIIYNHPTNSANILSKPVVVTIIYTA